MIFPILLLALLLSQYLDKKKKYWVLYQTSLFFVYQIQSSSPINFPNISCLCLFIPTASNLDQVLITCLEYCKSI